MNKEKKKESVKKKKIRLKLVLNAFLLDHITSSKRYLTSYERQADASYRQYLERKSRQDFQSFLQLIKSPFILFDNAVWLFIASNASGGELYVSYAFSPFCATVYHNMRRQIAPSIDSTQWTEMVVAFGPFLDIQFVERLQAKLQSKGNAMQALQGLHRYWIKKKVPVVLWNVLPDCISDEVRLLFKSEHHTNDRHSTSPDNTVENR